ncbi:sigma-K factor [Mycobacterium phage Benvolio]|uniref:Helix-turn-helix DNA-binding domain protein n=1 Tax=Mycobacterium phage Benvolio TaxID=2591074 RepID=A0A514A3N1_9CAUD|nr:sigma-K factor [Mycobacterium phage Echild]YP_010063488.1 sigma-K factor [Mycobacterium phage Benvolio]AHG24275.1 putative transcription factor [Mycobacterium phage Echild]QDH47869.1 helix-turn-helix DNA-binding domain protein [Mycobacterium phage Benvolio]
MNDDIIRRGARKALFAWKQDDSELDDLTNDLWVWYLERPGTQRKMAKLTANEAVETVKLAALQMLSGKQLASNEFNGRNLYSSEAVKEALSGTSTNRYLVDILPLAMKALDNQNESYAEAIRSRYDDGISPQDKSGQNALVRAHKALTDHVNVIAITAGVDADGNVTEGPGSRHAVFPETRPTSGGHSDPTADIAILLIEHPELRDDYLYESPLPEFLGGRCHAQPA